MSNEYPTFCVECGKEFSGKEGMGMTCKTCYSRHYKVPPDVYPLFILGLRSRKIGKIAPKYCFRCGGLLTGSSNNVIHQSCEAAKRYPDLREAPIYRG